MRMDYPVDALWYAYSHVWESAQCLTGSAAGPIMIPSYEHLLCEDFARLQPDSAEFLLNQLLAPNPYLAGYAFKCLIRVKPDLRAEDLPPGVMDREEVVAFQALGCVARPVKLGDFFRGYFDQNVHEDDDEDDDS